MVSYTTRMPAGFPGRISRSESLTVEASVISATNPPSVYGLPVKLVNGQLQAIASADAATVVYGFLVAPYPTQGPTTANALGAAAGPGFGVADVMRRGYMISPLAGGVAVKGGQVFMVTTAGGAFTVGQLVASASPGSSAAAVAITNCTFTGAADANGNVEIEYAIAP